LSANLMGPGFEGEDSSRPKLLAIVMSVRGHSRVA